MTLLTRDPDEERPEAFAGSLAEQIGGPPVRYEKIQPVTKRSVLIGSRVNPDGLPSALDRLPSRPFPSA